MSYAVNCSKILCDAGTVCMSGAVNSQVLCGSVYASCRSFTHSLIAS